MVVKKWHNVLLNIENAEGEAYQKAYEDIDIFLKQFPHLRHVETIALIQRVKS